MPDDQSRIVTEVTRRHRPLTFLRHVRVCAYDRVSTDHDGQQDSLPNQTQYYEHWFSSTQLLQFIGNFSDTSISDVNENRSGFKAMLARAR
ncbi:MAG: recombinase family protein [Clostridiaceae bacterium]|nr:recombinase family protein [Clostridiaceae bacterium]